MSETATEPRLRVGPPPEGYTDGPVTVMLDPNDGEPADDVKTFPSLDDALAFAETAVKNGFLAGTLTFHTDKPARSALEQQVADEQAAFEVDTRGTVDVEITNSTVPVEVVTGTEVVEDAADFRIERVAYDDSGAKVKREHENLTLAQARELFKPMRCRAGSNLRIVAGDDTIIDRKKPALEAVPEVEPQKGIGADQADGEQQPQGPDPEPSEIDELTEHARDAVEDEVFHEIASAPEGPEEASGQKTLIDRTEYEREDLQLPKVDGQAIDRLALKFSGTVFLDRSDPSDVALYRQYQLGRDVTIMVEGKCSSTGAKGATDRDGDLDVVIGEKGIKVHSVYLPAAEAE